MRINLFKLLLPIFLASFLGAQEFKIFKLYNNSFQAVFPDKPTILKVPKELLSPEFIKKSIPDSYKNQLSQREINEIVANAIEQTENISSFEYIDRVRKIGYTLHNVPSMLEPKNYRWAGIKQQLDELLRNEMPSADWTLTSFSSTFDKNEQTYTAYSSAYYQLEGRKVYISTKRIFHKDRSYKWSISSIDSPLSKTLFEKYSIHCKVLQ